ncbi:LysR family transcriptional regulator [Paraoerskovia marina]|uniref:LysR family transcriptional regulator n=1 Tax=Paraoerskovia marina TaxID=545619 RepID=UPI000492A4C3|nr:LysR family transcriptional regulator [Paraoerskovia marina]
MIDLGAVQAIVAIDRCGSVGGAADELGFTSSAISQQVKRLEAQMGAVLVERAGRGVVLTAAGRQVAAAGADLATRVEALRSGVQAEAGQPTGLIRLATFSTAMRGLVPGLIAAVRRDAPDLDVAVRELDPWDAVADVAAGRSDVALVHHWEGVGLQIPPALRRERVLLDVADVLVHRDDPLAGREVVTATQLLDRPWASSPEGTICHEWFCHMFRDAGRTPTVAFRCLEFASQVELVAHGLAVALVPRLGRGTLPASVVAIPARDPEPTRPVDVVWRASMTASPAVAAVRGAAIAQAG